VPPVETPDQSPAASVGPLATPTAAPPATPIPRLLRLTLRDAGPVITAADGPPGSLYALPAAATRDRDGVDHLLIVWFGDNEDPPKITLATSRDGQRWRVSKTPILEAFGLGVPRPGRIPSALLQLDDGSWQMYGWVLDVTHEGMLASWRATAPSLDGPWTIDDDRVLGPGPTGAWDGQAAAIGSVQRTSTGFAAWFEGQPPGRTLRGDLGYATSTDGLDWRKFNDTSTDAPGVLASDPVIARGICGPGSGQAVYQPQVELAANGGYVAAFGAFEPSSEHMDVFGGVSDDGIRWTCGSPEPLLGYSGIPRSEGIHSLASFPLGDGRIGLLVESLLPDRSEIWLARVEPVG
jgi:hypothetical protein